VLSIIIPAHNEAGHIDACLHSVLASTGPDTAQVIVAANGCKDDTVLRAQAFERVAQGRGWQLEVLDLPAIGKVGALNQADQIAAHDMRVYLDADVTMDPDLLGQIKLALNTAQPRFVSGKMRLAPAKSWATRAYARIYGKVPFMTQGVPGAGLFAVNAAGRSKWDQFPTLIADDTFVRLTFSPDQRDAMKAGYDWPLVEGFFALVKVRRRQNAGVAEVGRKFPHLLENDDKLHLSFRQKLRMGVRDPLGMLVYGAVAVIVKLTPQRDTSWERGR